MMLTGVFTCTQKAQVFIRAADLVVLLYREASNSGGALLPLPLARPKPIPSREAP